MFILFCFGIYLYIFWYMSLLSATTFLDACPDFDARDKQLTIVPTSSNFGRLISKGDNGHNQYMDVLIYIIKF